MRTLLNRLRSATKAVCRPFHPLLHLIAYYPLLLVPTVGLGFLVTGAVLGDYNAFNIIWNESPAVGIVNGLLVAFVLGIVVLAVHLADEKAAAGVPAASVPPAWKYRLAWGLLLVGAASPAVWKWSPVPDAPSHAAATAPATTDANGVAQSASPAWRFWFPTGLAAMAALFFLGGRQFPAAVKSTPKAGAVVLLVLGVGYLGMIVLHAAFRDLYCPFFPASVSVFLLLAFVTAFLGAVTWLAQHRRAWLYPVVLLIAVLPFLFPDNQVENRLPNMTAGKDGPDYYKEPAVLAKYDSLRNRNDTGLADDLLTLKAWHDKMKADFDGEPQPLVIVTCSGGASASAILTAEVLFALEEQTPGFSKRIRLISGASGGMLGASYFVTQLRDGGRIARAKEDPRYKAYLEYRSRSGSAEDPAFAAVDLAYKELMRECHDDLFDGLKADFLSPLVQKWVHKDVPLSPYGVVSGHTTNDRGAALERAWASHLTKGKGEKEGALDVPFVELRNEERRGELPSLVFTPMMIEDGRQLVVSNLDLAYMTESGRDEMAEEKMLSYMGAEFFKLFPKADQFRLSTAVRMNASFPFFSPAAALPTDPVRHVVDAGYYDNYGMVAACKWLLRPENRGFLAGKYAQEMAGAKQPPEVYLLRIRCFGNERLARMLPTEDELDKYAGRTLKGNELAGIAKEWADTGPRKPAVSTEGGLFTLTAPLTGALASRKANMMYRADERLSAVLREYNGDPKARPVTLRQYAIDCNVEPSLNWVLPEREVQAIRANARQLATDLRLANYFNGNGTDPLPDVPLAGKPGVGPLKNPDKDTAKFVAESYRKRAETGAATPDDQLTQSQKNARAMRGEFVGKVSQFPVPKSKK